MPSTTRTTMTARAASAIHQPIIGSTACAAVNTSRIWATRPGFLGVLEGAESLRAMRFSLPSGDTGQAPLDQRGSLLACGGVGGLGEVRQLLRHRTSRALHRLRPQPTGTVGGAHQWPAHDALEADLLGELGPTHELLRLDPPVHRVVAG